MQAAQRSDAAPAEAVCVYWVAARSQNWVTTNDGTSFMIARLNSFDSIQPMQPEEAQIEVN